MEVGPPGSPYRAEIPNQRQVLRSRAVVLSVTWKRPANERVRCATRRRTRVNHCLRIETNNDGIETGVGPGPREKLRMPEKVCLEPGGGPVCCLGGVRCIGGVTSSQAPAWNRRTCRPDTRQPRIGRHPCLAAKGRTPSGKHRKGQSTDAGHRGGPACSSDEGPVMGLERRGRTGQATQKSTLFWGMS